MYNLRIFITVLCVVCGSLGAHSASLTNAIHWAWIGNTNNTGDANPAAVPTSCGNVAYFYEIMNTEVTVTQYNECGTTNLAAWTNEPVRFVAFSNAMAYADWLTTNGLVPVLFTNNIKVVYTNDPAQTITNWTTNTFTNYYLLGAYSNSILASLPQHASFTNWMNYVYRYPFPNPTNDPGVSKTNIITGDWFKLPGFTNHVYLVPTEDEWYKAAYGSNGTPATYFTYPCTNGSPTTNEFNYGNWTNDICVVSNTPNGVSSYGAYDMGGNVWEWIEPPNPPTVPINMAIIRGGSYFSRDPRDLSRATREYHAATNAVKGIGFRLIRIPIPQPP